MLLMKNIFSFNNAKIGAILFSNIDAYMKPISNLNELESNSASYFGST